METAPVFSAAMLKLSALWETPTRVSSIVNNRKKKLVQTKRSRWAHKVMQVKYRIPAAASCSWSTSFKSQKKVFGQFCNMPAFTQQHDRLNKISIIYIKNIEQSFYIPSLLDKNTETKRFPQRKNKGIVTEASTFA